MNFDNIPQELQQRKQWVLWRLETINGRETKIPYQPNGYRAESDNPSTWSDYATVVNAFRSGQFSGIGLMFADGIFGIDFDHVAENGKLESWVIPVVEMINSYTEWSQSKTGLHILGIGKKPSKECKSKNVVIDGVKVGKKIEFYDSSSGRFFVMTGNHLEGTPTKLEKRRMQLSALHSMCFPKPEQKTATASSGNGSNNLTDDEIVRICRKAQNSAKFIALYDNGDISQHDNDRSSADMALCSILAFYTKDEDQIERIFSQSKLSEREKWQRSDYRERTIRRAIDNTPETFSPKPFSPGPPPPSDADAPLETSQDYYPKPNGNQPKEKSDLKKCQKLNDATCPKNELEMFLVEQWEIRRNIIKRKPEIKQNDEWKEINEDILNDILRSLRCKSKNFSKIRLIEIIQSSLYPKFDPFKSYFDFLPEWDQEDWIEKLSDCVILTDNDEKERFKRSFKKWLVAVVASAYDAKPNHQCLILQGAQSRYKTTFLSSLNPPILKDYLYIGTIQGDKDSLMYLTSAFLINDDELETLNSKEIGTFKRLVTQDLIKYRPPYSRWAVNEIRRASFMGSVNRDTFLTDETGTRRFLCFAIEIIDFAQAKKIDINNVYAQAFHLYKSGFQYWFDAGESDEITQRNSGFEIKMPAEELIPKYFMATDDNNPSNYWTATDIGLHIIQKEKENRNIQISLRNVTVGKALAKLKHKKKNVRINGKPDKRYILRRIESNESGEANEIISKPCKCGEELDFDVDYEHYKSERKLKCLKCLQTFFY